MFFLICVICVNPRQKISYAKGALPTFNEAAQFPVFPNSQDALPLPLRPDLERYKKLAKDLVKACKLVDPDAIGDWAEAWVKTLGKRSGIKLGRKESRAIGRWTDQVEAFAQRLILSRARRAHPVRGKGSAHLVRLSVDGVAAVTVSAHLM